MMNCNILKKKLIYKASNRGWKETDILLGNFVKENVNQLTDEQLIMLDLLLDESDAEIFSWITKKTLVSTKHDNEVMQMLQSYVNVI